MPDRPTALPESLEAVADVVGEEKALLLARALGGTEDNYIPVKARADHAIALAIGLGAMAALCKVFGGQRLDIPRAVYYRQANYAIPEETGSNREVALRLGVTQRYVRKVRNKQKDRRQGSLF